MFPLNVSIENSESQEIYFNFELAASNRFSTDRINTEEYVR